MSSPGSPAPTTAFPLLPDELDDAVYDAYVVFVADNLRGWLSSRTLSVSRSRSASIPPTPALTTAPSTPDCSVRTPTTPFPTILSGHAVPPRSSSLPLVRASPPNPSIKHRISAPMPLRTSWNRSSTAHVSLRSSSTLSNCTLSSNLSHSASISRLSHSPSSSSSSNLGHSTSSSLSHSSSNLSHSTSSSLYNPSILDAQVHPVRAYDPFTDGFTHNLTKRSIMSEHFELPDLPLPPADIWHRGSNSSASSALPSIKEVNEERRPVERVWW
ncbi:hypothetical protein CcaverHIS002_0311830 [Cutaneotrichosporon cavernicola]|uniref:Uncharacterized protein n=1 Tax=Cutaneotrichosporon cavernicola TaxID=279322 RepID=A0AA48L356_9TREE|nr:uncharacterized protein CcaverHIS019_0311700 [Cutaneotrichosporon cavernicola]BEI83315.1 hypothetical protein CcaverHIS002_0311830 [Cutaneotrichosporon cavernicola]BEI91100.1 hypothetical protein CcaverHIS019_0311700 [Cutaneotrichosporon cavernicola]BEI98877.1 hypothetical protein CcaverHIS631_0311760 [Cutaneotrichosporon cavernicola]BEJ06650.1 hypothetical protein CcaverHIS641_0311720 [Cutaneotrichosporon cavernicola]